ncbi:hypothetical protein [Streptomyces sp. NPDC092952]
MNTVLALQGFAAHDPPGGGGGPLELTAVHSSMSFNCASDNTDE